MFRSFQLAAVSSVARHAGLALRCVLSACAIVLWSKLFGSDDGTMVASVVFSGHLFNSMKKVLDEIVDDDSDGMESGLLMPKYFKVSSMTDGYDDDLEMAGPGLAQVKHEGGELPMGTIREGAKTRYLPTTFALGLAVTEEASEDAKYPQVLSAARRLKRAMWKTVDYEAANVLIRGFNTDYVGGDNVCLWSASHTIPGGATFSNLMGTPVAPSVQAVTVATTQIKKFVGHDGLFDKIMPKCIVCPVDQWEAWSVITKSTHRPEAGEINAINVVNNELKLDVYPNVYWSTTTTNWAMMTDADNGLRWKWRVRPESKSWTNEGPGIFMYRIRARWARLWTDARGTLGVNA